MPPVYSLTPRLSSNHAAIANASRCCSPISSASCGLVASGCAAHVARKTSSRSQLSHRTYAGSPNCSLDHHQWPLRVPPNRCGRQYHYLKTAAPNGVGGNRWLQKSLQPPRSSDRRLLQQNRHFSDLARCPDLSPHCAQNRTFTSGCRPTLGFCPVRELAI